MNVRVSCRRLAGLLGAAVLSFIALSSGIAGAAKLPPGAAPYGLVASNANFVPGNTLAERTANYRRLYRAGVRAIRVDINWEAVEPVGKPLHDYDFRERDREVRAITAAGLRIIPILAYGANPKLGRCYDVMAYHPYPYPFTAPELDVPVRGSVLAAADAMHAVIARHGDGRKPLWISEVGWPTHSRSYGVSEEKQAEYVARMNAATFARRLPVLTWYTYGDYADPTGANQEAYFGFFRPDGTAKPSYFALRTFSRVFAGTRFI